MNPEAALVCSDNGNLWQRVAGETRNPWLEIFDRDLVVDFLERLGPNQTFEKLDHEIVVRFTPFDGSKVQLGLTPLKDARNLAAWKAVAANTSKSNQVTYWVRYRYV